jgi:hypothetical protein
MKTKLPAGAYYLDAIEHIGMDVEVPNPHFCGGQSTSRINLTLIVNPRDIPAVLDGFYEDRVRLIVETPSRGRRARS